MKKTILFLLIGVGAISATAFGLQSKKEASETLKCNANKSEECTEIRPIKVMDFHSVKTKNPFFYEVDSRFATTMTKTSLAKAKSVFDIFPKDATQGIGALENVKVVLLNDGEEIALTSPTAELTKEQLNFISTWNYSDDFYVYGNYKKLDPITGKEYEEYIVYYITIIPEKEATYADGHDAFMSYLKKGSIEAVRDVKKERLKPGKARFTVTEDGLIDAIELDATSGYEAIDKKMMELLKEAPSKWNVAKDANGKTISQEYVFSFGIVGC